MYSVLLAARSEYGVVTFGARSTGGGPCLPSHPRACCTQVNRKVVPRMVPRCSQSHTSLMQDTGHCSASQAEMPRLPHVYFVHVRSTLYPLWYPVLRNQCALHHSQIILLQVTETFYIGEYSVRNNMVSTIRCNDNSLHGAPYSKRLF